MSEDLIQELLRKYLEGRATPREKKAVDDWYASLSPARRTWDLSDEEDRALRNKYWDSLRAEVDKSRRRKSLVPRVIGMAASVSVLGILLILYFQKGERKIVLPDELRVAMREIANDTDSMRLVRLADSSQVALFPGSSLQFDPEFNLADRRIHLSGQAFFEISRDESKPFYVFAGEVVTKVLGTSFTVRAYPDDQRVTVSVRSGKVSVYTRSEGNAVSGNVILTPNQEAVYTRDDQRVARKLVEQPQVIIPHEEVNKIRFERAPLPEILRTLEKMYGVEILFDEEVFSDCAITISVDGDDLYDRIDVICEITGSTYEIRDAQIFISGSGCN